MTTKRRNPIRILLTLVAILVLLPAAGCKPGPTIIIGSVSYLNTATMNRLYPPAGHSGDFTDDVAYARLVDNGGAGVTLWESGPFSIGAVMSGLTSGITSDEGEYIDSFVITLTDAQVNGASMPLRLEVFLYDTPVTGAFPVLDPATDLELYSEYDAAGAGSPQWYSLIDINVHDVKTSSLSATLPFA